MVGFRKHFICINPNGFSTKAQHFIPNEYCTCISIHKLLSYFPSFHIFLIFHATDNAQILIC